jgi:hypothetical protein
VYIHVHINWYACAYLAILQEIKSNDTH